MNKYKKCPLCYSNHVRLFANIDKKDYFKCETCSIVYLDSVYFLNANEELNRYKSHINNPNDTSYRIFLGGLFEPLIKYLKAPALGLDYGCGPGPTLSLMLEEIGFEMKLYDLYFYPNESVLNENYDFITCTETVEHFHKARFEFDRFDTLLKKGAYLGIMTKFLADNIEFEKWYYRRDPTHVCFYCESTFRYIEKLYNWEIQELELDIVIFRK